MICNRRVVESDGWPRKILVAAIHVPLRTLEGNRPGEVQAKLLMRNGVDDRALRPGKDADVVVLGGIESTAFRPRPDPVGSAVFQSSTRDLGDVFIAGKLITENGELVGVNLRSVLDRADNSAAATLARVRSSKSPLPPLSESPFASMEEGLRRDLAEAQRPASREGSICAGGMTLTRRQFQALRPA